METENMKLNASGYTDYPCYSAITKLDQPKPGEIWVHEKGAHMIVMSNEGGVCVTIRLNNAPRDEKSVQVTARVPMWINPAFIGYCFHTQLTQFIKIADKEEFEAVKDAIAVVLDLVEDELEETEEEEAKPVTEQEVDQAIDLEEKVALLQLELGIAKNMAAKAETYKEMYEQLLERLIGGKA